MPTVRTVTVKSSGGDYSSLSGAEAGEQGDLVSLDRQLDIECYAFDDTTACSISGWTTDPTRYIRVFCPPGEGHEGVWSTSKYRRRSSTGFGGGLTIGEEYVRLEGLQCYQPSGTYTGLIVTSGMSVTSDVRIDRCLLNGNGATLSVGAFNLGTGTISVRNCVAYTNGGRAVNAMSSGGSHAVHFENCTLIGSTYGIDRQGGTVTATNCYVHGGTEAYNGAPTLTTCAHSSATSFSGSTASVAYSTANFTNVTGGSEDLHLVTGSALIDAGTDLSGSFTTDIDGATRSGTWDIGADEFAGGGGGGSGVIGGVIGCGCGTRFICVAC